MLLFQGCARCKENYSVLFLWRVVTTVQAWIFGLFLLFLLTTDLLSTVKYFAMLRQKGDGRNVALVKRKAPSSVRDRTMADIGACSCSTTRRLHTLKEKRLGKGSDGNGGSHPSAHLSINMISV